MILTRDMKDLMALFEKHAVRDVLVGGFAVNYYGYVRMTQDVDFLVYPSDENARKIMASLDEFEFGKAGIPQEYFEKEGSAIHLGVEPNRIDLLTCLRGIDNDGVFARLRRVEYEGIRIPIISREDLLRAKKNSSRTRDLADAEELEKINRPPEESDG